MLKYYVCLDLPYFICNFLFRFNFKDVKILILINSLKYILNKYLDKILTYRNKEV